MPRLTRSQRANIRNAALLACAFGSPALAQYPAGPQITKDGTAVMLQDYTSVPLSGVTTLSMSGQLSRVNFLRSEPANAPQSANRFFVADNNRNFYILDKATKSFSTYMNFQNIFPKFDNDPYSAGIVGIAFDPEYATNGKFYTEHTENPSIAGTAVPNNFPGFSNAGYTTTAAVNPPLGTTTRQGILVEWTDTNLNNNTFEGTAREVLRIGFNSNIHRMGDLLFNPSAHPGDADYRNLYMTNGDGEAGETFSTRQIPQRLDSLNGKILRITPDTTLRPATSTISANGRYTIPSSGADPNPFVATSGARPEVFAYGFRNPHRLFWDGPTNKLFVNDIGLVSWEEVNVVQKGANYGYSEREGTEQLFITNGTPNNWKTGSQTSPPTPFPSPDTLTVTGVGSVTPNYPVVNYSHRDGDGIGSGFVYRGSLIPELVGKYVFNDITTGRLFYSDASDMLAADDGVRTTLADMHELQVVYDSPYNAAPLENRRLYDIVADEYAHKGGDPQPSSASGVLPGRATVVGGWQGATFTPGTTDLYGQQYGGGRADVRIVVGGDGEIYVLSKSDAMIRQLTGAMHFWNTLLSGNWSSTASWTNGVANGVGYNANFGPASAPRTVTVDGAKTAGLLYFNSSAGSYTLTGSAINLDAAAPQAAIYVAAGNHTISAPLSLIDNTTITVVPPTSTLAISNLQQTSASVTKTGAGALSANHIRAASLVITAGSVRIAPNGSASGVTAVSTLSIDQPAGAALDLADNDLIVNAGVFTTIRAQVLSGFGASTGITSSTSNGSQILALFDNALVGAPTWQGITISPTAVVGKYTFFGDVNFDGQVTGDDYTIIDSNLNTTPPAGLAWLSGDANLDGLVTGDDYTTIDSNLGLGAGNPLSPSHISTTAASPFAPSRSATPIPEPASLIFLLPTLLSPRRSPRKSRGTGFQPVLKR